MKMWPNSAPIIANGTANMTKNGCVKETEEHKLLERMLADKSNNSANWPRPIVVYGYDDSHPLFGGDVFEAETTCSNEHNMGQVASH